MSNAIYAAILPARMNIDKIMRIVTTANQNNFIEFIARCPYSCQAQPR